MGANFGSRNRDHLALDFWLVIADPGTDKWNGKPGVPGVRVTAGYPEMKRNERAINLKMKVPLALFSTPSLKATINIADPGDAQVNIDVPAIAEAVRGAIGMDVDLQVVDQHGQVIE